MFNFVTMGNTNSYIEKNIPILYRKQILDVMIFTYIDCQRFTIPGITVEDSSLSFMKRHGVDPEEMTIEKIRTTYYRIQKELLNEHKRKSKSGT